MAIFDKETTKENNSYIALFDKTGEIVVAYVNPVKDMEPKVLVDKLVAKGLKVEIRERSDRPELTTVEL